MNRTNLLFLLTFILSIYSATTAQDFSGEIPYRHYNIKDGLAGSNVMSFLQDNDGFIWFATSNGLSRFDGSEFKNYTVANGLGSNNLSGLAQLNDTLIIASYDNGLYFYENDQIQNYSIKNKTIPFIHHLAEYDNHLFAYWNYLYDISNGSITDVLYKFRFQNIQEKSGFHITSIEELNDGNILLCSSSGLFIYKNKQLYKYYLNGIDKNSLFTCVFKTQDNKILLCGKGSIWVLNDGRINKLFSKISIQKDKSISHVFVDDFNNLWFSETNSGLYVIKDSIIYDIGKKIGLEKSQINFIKSDREGNIWVGTIGKGVYCFFNLSVTSFSAARGLKNTYILSINSADKSQVLIGTFNGLFAYDNGNFNQIKTGFNGAFSYIRNIQYLGNNTFFITGSFDMSKNRYSKISIVNNNRIVYKIISSAASYVINEDSIIIGGWNSDITVIKTRGNFFVINSQLNLSYNKNKDYRINKLYKDRQGQLWIGSAGGLCLLSNGRQKYFEDNPILSSDIKDIKQGPDNTIWIAGASGISTYKNNLWRNYSKIDNCDLTSSSSITFDNDGDAWVGNVKGLYRISKNKVIKYDDEFGLGSKEINSVSFDHNKNELWVGTNEGLYKIEMNVYKQYPQFLPVVKLEFIEANDSVYKNYSNLDFNSNINKIKIHFACIYFRNPKGMTFQYSITNKENKWTSTDSPEIQFASLSPGKYDILIRAKSLYSDWSAPARVSFLIKTPFIKSYWFYSLIVLCIVVPAVFITRRVTINRQKKIEEKKIIENKIVELKQQALSAMMNPHFIFNSLNSIQNFINNHDKKEANNFLTKFAKLIRLNLDVAQESFISLQEEIDRLKLYLSLEKMRFGENFNYSIVVDEKLDKNETKLPNMIIQPFVENAIWHGILPNSEKGNLTIKFCLDSLENLQISVIDDGVGFNENFKNNVTNHVPRGINVIRERLKLLNPDNGQENILTIKSKDTLNESGTTVKIIIPKLNLQNYN